MSSSNADFPFIPKIDVDSEISKEKMRTLSEKCKSVVWLLFFRSRDSDSGGDRKFTRTAFSIDEEGLVMTTKVEFMDSHVICARRLTDAVICNAEVERESEEFNIAILRVTNKNNWIPCSFATDGTLRAGQTLFYIANFRYLVGSLLMGKVRFACVNDYTPQKEPTKPWETPLYRTMGDCFPKSNDPAETKCFEAQFDPTAQVIQLYTVGGEGCQGAPVFTVNGDVIGMVVMRMDGHEFALHLSVLKQFLSKRTEKGKGSKRTEKGKGSKRTEKGKGKFKR